MIERCTEVVFHRIDSDDSDGSASSTRFPIQDKVFAAMVADKNVSINNNNSYIVHYLCMLKQVKGETDFSKTLFSYQNSLLYDKVLPQVSWDLL